MTDTFLNNNTGIEKDLVAEAKVKDQIHYIKVAGASNIEKFRSPDAFVLLIMEKFQGIHEIDFVRYKQKDLQIHISFPGQLHSWNTEEGAQGHKLIISKKFMESFLFDSYFIREQINHQPIIKISKKLYDLLFIDLSILDRELSSKTCNWETIQLRTLLILKTINNLLVNQKKKDRQRLPQIIKDFNRLVETNFIDQRSIPFYAQALGISAGHLTVLCRKYFDKTAKEMIDQRIILEAKHMLLGTELTIKEIMYALKFSSLAHFSHYCKARTGLNPKQIRKGILGQK